MFHHGNISAHAPFCAADGTRNFRHLHISAHGYFGTLQSNMDISAQTFRHLCYCAEMSMCRNVPVPKSPRAEKSPCRNVPVLKCPSAGMSAALNGACAEMFPWWNICAEMTLAEMFRAKMVYRPAVSSNRRAVPNQKYFNLKNFKCTDQKIAQTKVFFRNGLEMDSKWIRNEWKNQKLYNDNFPRRIQK